MKKFLQKFFSNLRQDPEYDKLKTIDTDITSMLDSTELISLQEAYSLKHKWESTIQHFVALHESEEFTVYCKKYKIKPDYVSAVLQKYDSFMEACKAHNQDCYNGIIDRNSNLVHIVCDLDSNIVLDREQLTAVIAEDKNVQVIAGAGTGKTATIAAKAKYLVEWQGIAPQQILITSYTRKAVDEIVDRIQNKLKIPSKLSTFHHLGIELIKENTGESYAIANELDLRSAIQDFFRTSIMEDPELVNQVVLLFAPYINSPYTGSDINDFFNIFGKESYETLKSRADNFIQVVSDRRFHKNISMNDEFVLSYQEVEIANFLYLNSVPYIYRGFYYKHIQYKNGIYIPDFIVETGTCQIYIEFFNVSSSFQNTSSTNYTECELKSLHNAWAEKVQLHRQNDTCLISLFAEYPDGRNFIDVLKEELESYGVQMYPRSNQEIFEMLIRSEKNNYIRKLIDLIIRFISIFKAQGHKLSYFDTLSKRNFNPRTLLFLEIAQRCYQEYESYLNTHHLIDFDDMIIKATDLLKNPANLKKIPQYKWIIVDEFQDISQARFNFILELKKLTGAHLMVVGDDWQSIFHFAGSDINLFTNFEKMVGPTFQVSINHTYRNSMETVNIAGTFAMKNDAQIKKKLYSDKHIVQPIMIYPYQHNKYNSGKMDAFEQIIYELHCDSASDHKSLLLLGRYRSDVDFLLVSRKYILLEDQSTVISTEFPGWKMTFLTVHASKGTTFENVILLDACSGTYGFPCRIEDDPVLQVLLQPDTSYLDAEERRLFYVAITRTKGRTYILTPRENPSSFLIELQDYPNVVCSERLKQSESTEKVDYCPICGHKLQIGYNRAYGLKLYMCTNDPNLCNFATINPKAGRLPIMKCAYCRDGLLIQKSDKNGNWFLGCTNYDITGCTNCMSPKDVGKRHLNQNSSFFEF